MASLPWQDCVHCPHAKSLLEHCDDSKDGDKATVHVAMASDWQHTLPLDAVKPVPMASEGRRLLVYVGAVA